MTIELLAAVLAAAFLHALWNALIKIGGSKIGVMVIMSVFEIVIGGLVVLFTPPMASAAIPWVLASGCAHFAYKFFLCSAYEHGDLSRVYPIARGAAPMIVALTGTFFLADQLSLIQYAAVIMLGCGILLMASGVFRSAENRKLLPFAFGSAIATASYTLLDGSGARVSESPIAYVAWVFVIDGLYFTVGIVAWRGVAMIPRAGEAWVKGAFAGVASFGAYAISIWAMTLAPIALVAALRETSILFAVLIGWIAFGERMSFEKAIAAGVIVMGVILTRF